MPNFRLEWLQLNDASIITGIVGVEEHTLAGNTHHTFTPPQYKLRRHSTHIVARIAYAHGLLFIKSDSLNGPDVTSETGYMYRHRNDVPASDLLWEIQQDEALYVLQSVKSPKSKV